MGNLFPTGATRYMISISHFFFLSFPVVDSLRAVISVTIYLKLYSDTRHACDNQDQTTADR